MIIFPYLVVRLWLSFSIDYLGISHHSLRLHSPSNLLMSAPFHCDHSVHKEKKNTSQFCVVCILTGVWPNSYWPASQVRITLSPPASAPEANNWGEQCVVQRREGPVFQCPLYSLRCWDSSPVPATIALADEGWGQLSHNTDNFLNNFTYKIIISNVY